MKSSDQPGKIYLPFSSSGSKQAIPIASQIGIAGGRASYTDGFPPLTRTPLAAGGRPPYGTDMNGILYAVTAIQQWQSAGGLFRYDSDLSTRIGGYPKGATLAKASGTGIWQSTVDDNTSDPDAGGAGWASISASSPGGVARFTTSGSFTVPDGVTEIFVSGCGGGGGGGGGAGSSSSAGPGGGGGGGAGRSAVKERFTVTPGQVIAVTIGTAGSGGSGSTTNGGNGSAGGSTSLAGLISLSGGGGGNGGNGSTGSGGDGGAPGGQWGTDAQIPSTGGNGGSGGSGPFGTGGGGGRGGLSAGTTVSGTIAFGFGAGGAGGGSNYSSTTGRSGAAGLNGMPGLLIIEW